MAYLVHIILELGDAAPPEHGGGRDVVRKLLEDERTTVLSVVNESAHEEARHLLADWKTAMQQRAGRLRKSLEAEVAELLELEEAIDELDQPLGVLIPAKRSAQ